MTKLLIALSMLAILASCGNCNQSESEEQKVNDSLEKLD